MTVIRRSALVPYSAHEMFLLVSDIERYPEFLPWCGGAHVLSREHETVIASIDIAYKGLARCFTTSNRLYANERMEMHLVEGPFSKLDGDWTFLALDDASSKISLDLEFEFSNRLLGMAMGPVFGAIANSMVDGFRSRAKQVYGDGGRGV
ncbi:MAG: type II toxin-antitoxin system RatA family toxin [Acidiferrobacteraceae bacterium]